MRFMRLWLLLMCAGLAYGQYIPPGTGGGGPTTAATVATGATVTPTCAATGGTGTVSCTATTNASGAATVSIVWNGNNTSPTFTCWDTGVSPAVGCGGTGSSASLQKAEITDANTVKLTFSADIAFRIQVNAGNAQGPQGTTGAQGPQGAAGSPIRTCTVIIGDPGAASSALADDNDSPVACGNAWGSDFTITSVSCWANAGSPTITPILTAGGATSILTGALTCGTASWGAGTINGTPVLHTFSANGATCAATPCTADVNITTAGGTAKYIVVRITGTL